MQTDKHKHSGLFISLTRSLTRSLSLFWQRSQCVCVCVCDLKRCKHKDYICYVPGPLSHHHRGPKEPTTLSQKHTHSHIHHRHPHTSADIKPAYRLTRRAFLLKCVLRAERETTSKKSERKQVIGRIFNITMYQINCTIALNWSKMTVKTFVMLQMI